MADREQRVRFSGCVIGFGSFVIRWLCPPMIAFILWYRLSLLFREPDVLTKAAQMTGIPVALQVTLIVWTNLVCLATLIVLVRGKFEHLTLITAGVCQRIVLLPAHAAVGKETWGAFEPWAYGVFGVVSIAVPIYALHKPLPFMDLRKRLTPKTG